MTLKYLDGWRISFILNLTVFLTQQVGLYYILFNYNKFILLLCIFDFYIFVHLCLNNVQWFAAVKGGTCWLLYMYSISLKVIFMYFFSFDDNSIFEYRSIDYYYKCIVFFLLSLSTVVYTTLSVQSYKQLYPDNVSIFDENIFHNDLMLHVVIDLFDIFELLFTFVKLSYIFKETKFWIKTIVGVFISSSLYLNAYSFPIISIITEKKKKKKLDLGDIYFCKKHAAVIGIILIDVPFMLLRLYLLTFHFSNIQLHPLLIKNICFIPINCMNIKYCNMAFEKLKKSVINTTEEGYNSDRSNYLFRNGNKANYKQKYRHNMDKLKNEYTNKNENNNVPNPYHTIQNKNMSGNTNRLSTSSKLFFHHIKSNFLKNYKKTNVGKNNNEYDVKPFKTVGTIDITKTYNKSNKTNLLTHQKNATTFTTVNNIHNINDIPSNNSKKSNFLSGLFNNIFNENMFTFRQINKNKIKLKYIINKLMYTNITNIEGYHIYLDDHLKVSHLNQICLMLPYIIYCIGKITISIVIYFFYKKFDIYNIKTILTQYNDYTTFFNKTNIIIIVTIFIILLNSIICFFSSILLCSFVEILFFVLFIFIKCFCDFLILFLLVSNHIFETFLQIFNLSDFYVSYFFLAFALLPSIEMIKYTYVFLCASSGRQFIGYIIKPFMNKKQKRKMNIFFKIKKYNNDDDIYEIKIRNNNIDQTFYNTSTNYLNKEFDFLKNVQYDQMDTVKRDYKGFISIAALLIYINTKNMHGVCSLSTLMIGNNFIKNIRVDNNLKNNHILSIIINFMCKFFLLLFIYMHYKSNDNLPHLELYFYCLVISTFLLDTFFKYCYMIKSHILRLNATKYEELKSIYYDNSYYQKKKHNNIYMYNRINTYLNTYMTSTFESPSLDNLYEKYQINHVYFTKRLKLC
ncbi:conserved membrane protein, unknown function [Hepatocystis sp. ex Piliocolobus tephrosceles]|nr:conserved membrane protein, unknown function [Hepatocystis sp. ex Piliocolobus tephrosceles]